MIYNFGKANILFLFYLWYNLDIMRLIYDIFFPILRLKQNSITEKQEEGCKLWGDYCCVTFEKQNITSLLENITNHQGKEL